MTPQEYCLAQKLAVRFWTVFSGLFKTVQTPRLQTRIFLPNSLSRACGTVRITLIQNAAGRCWVSGVEWETRFSSTRGLCT